MGEIQNRLTIEQSHGDSPWVVSMPRFMRGVARGLDGRDERRRNARMVRTVASLYPTLCQVERQMHGTEAECRLDGVPFQRAVNDDRAIERGLAVFDEAWKSGAIALRAANGKLIPPTRSRVIVPACGYSVQHARRYFVDRAARLILRRLPKVYDRLAAELTEVEMLPRLRRIAALPSAVVTELVRGFEGNIRRALFETDEALLLTLSQIRPPVLKALRETLTQDFPRLVTAGPAYLSAIAESFTVPEQVRDLGPELFLLTTPEAVRAVAAWDIHDITERVNQERERRGQPAVAGHVYSTDIRTLRGVLGAEFNHLLEFPAPLLAVFGVAARDLRGLDIAPRQARVEQMSLFCQRYMSYLTEDSIVALFLLAPDDQARTPAPLRPTISEVFFILEGLWGKKGYGRKFFETVIGTPEGAKALRLMMLDLVGLKERGSVKGAEDLTQIVANSDLLDSHILKFMALK
ncbi:hypothetical protein [Roseospira goensis]|uniref:Uncharacterized protein n=1 Tax=Roseospira goensis TaxID=391922 RepID=A0A7W6WL55_9PROT|nr:hypothetical protein [Roseospira goensis]MBB4286785.1 hypothetical protein [Roseospira goensis]